MKNKSMILTLEQFCRIDKETNKELLSVLYKIEDRLCYKCKKVSNTIDFLQKIISKECDYYEIMAYRFNTISTKKSVGSTMARTE